MTKITLTIDGRQITAEHGLTVLQVAQQAGIYIPTLCADDALEPFGACRLCIVQVERMSTADFALVQNFQEQARVY